MNKIKLSTVALLTIFTMGLASIACKEGCDKDKKAFGKGNGHFIKMADNNNDGKLDLTEMKANAALRFAEGDINKDGFLDNSEVKGQFKDHWKKKDIK